MREQTPHTSSALDALRSLPPRERVVALAGAIRVAPDEELGALAVELLDLAVADDGDLPAWVRRLTAPGTSRVADDALRTVVASWRRLEEETRRAALAVGAGRWGPVADTIIREGTAEEAVSLGELLLDEPDPGLAPQAAALIASPEPSVARAGERALTRMVLEAMEDTSPAELGAELGALAARPRLGRGSGLARQSDARILIRAVADSAWSYAEHRCSGPLLAGLLLLDQPLECASEEDAEQIRSSMARLHRLLDESSHPSHAAASTVLRRREGAVLRERAWRLLASPGLAAAAAERVSRATSLAEHQAVLRESHLIVNPKRRRACRLIDARTKRETTSTGALERLDPTGPIPLEADVRSLSARERLGVVALLGAVRAAEPARRLARAPLLADPDPRVRVMLAATADPIELADLCFDADERVAELAAHRWSVVGDPGGVRWPPRMREAGRARISTLLTMSPHASVRAVGSAELARLSPFSPGAPASRVAARRWLAEDPEGFGEQLEARLKSPVAGDRIDALKQIRALRAVDRFLDLVLGRLNDETEDDRVRATAVAALSRATGEDAISATRSALDDRDDRVRANAVESAARQSRGAGDLATSAPELYGSLIELKDDGRHRVRANALRALLGSGAPVRDRVYEPAAVDALESMLADPRAEHRVAGVWLAERAMSGAGQERLGQRWAELARRVARIAGEDPSEAARGRAGRCAARLLGEIRVRHGEAAIGGRGA